MLKVGPVDVMLEAVGDIPRIHILISPPGSRPPLKAHTNRGRSAGVRLPTERESWVRPHIRIISPVSNEIQRCIIALIRHFVDLELEP